MNGHLLRVRLVEASHRFGGYLAEMFDAQGRRLVALKFETAKAGKEFLTEWAGSTNGKLP